MVKFAVALSLIFFSDLLSAKTLLIETESSEEESGSGWMQNSWQNDWGNGNDYNEQTTRPARSDQLEKGK